MLIPLVSEDYEGIVAIDKELLKDPPLFLAVANEVLHHSYPGCHWGYRSNNILDKHRGMLPYPEEFHDNYRYRYIDNNDPLGSLLSAGITKFDSFEELTRCHAQ